MIGVRRRLRPQPVHGAQNPHLLDEQRQPTQTQRDRDGPLVDGQPQPLDLKTGLSDGRNTEISGEGVAEGLVVITSSVTKS